MTDTEKQAKLDEVSEILKKHGIYIALRSPEIYLEIFYKDDVLVNVFMDSYSVQLGETDLVSEH